jgi:hypothetical protein
MSLAPDDKSWITETGMLSLTGLPRSTFSSWTDDGFLQADPGAAYDLEGVLEIALLVEIRKFLGDHTVPAWNYLRDSDRDAEMVEAAAALERGGRFDLVFEPDHSGIAMARDDESLATAVRHPGAPRPVIVVDVADRLLLVREGFQKSRSTRPRPSTRRAGRPRRRAEVRVLHGGAS